MFCLDPPRRRNVLSKWMWKPMDREGSSLVFSQESNEVQNKAQDGPGVGNQRMGKQIH